MLVQIYHILNWIRNQQSCISSRVSEQWKPFSMYPSPGVYPYPQLSSINLSSRRTMRTWFFLLAGEGKLWKEWVGLMAGNRNAAGNAGAAVVFFFSFISSTQQFQRKLGFASPHDIWIGEWRTPMPGPASGRPAASDHEAQMVWKVGYTITAGAGSQVYATGDCVTYEHAVQNCTQNTAEGVIWTHAWNTLGFQIPVIIILILYNI